MAARTLAAWQLVAPATAAGFIGGAVVGAAESVWIVALGAAWPDDHDALQWGALLYGLLGGLGGAGVGVVLAVALRRRRVDPLDVFCLGIGGVLAAALLVVFRFRYQRDVLHELPPAVAHHAAWVGASIVIAVLSWATLSAVLRRGTRPGWRTFASAGLSLVALTMVASRLLPRSGTTTFDPPPGAHAKRPHILYVMADTVRADALSPYGADAETPASARLAADGIVFEQAVSQSSWTRPSVATQLTSLPPHRHGARWKSSSIRADAVLLPEALAAAGYYCIGIYAVGHIGPEWGFARGYHRYRSARGSRTGSLVVMRAIGGAWSSWRRATLRPDDFRMSGDELHRVIRDEWAAAPRDAPIFLFVHLMDAHDPYFPRGSAAILRDDGTAATERDRLRLAYREGVVSADANVHALLQWLEAQELYDDTLVVLVSDHGEEFYEHGGYWHGLTLYDELIHVPLIVKLPQKRSAGSRHAGLVRLLDVAPTVAAVAGVAAPSQWTGVSLIRDGAPFDPQLAATLSETDLEGGTLRALRTPRDKLILAAGRDRRRLPSRALFDLGVDAGEQTNLAADRGDVASRLEAELTRARDGHLWR